MTDQPTTQERCPTCGSDDRAILFHECEWSEVPGTPPDPWHGSQDVEGPTLDGEPWTPSTYKPRPAPPLADVLEPSPPTTQEAESCDHVPSFDEDWNEYHPKPTTQEAEKAARRFEILLDWHNARCGGDFATCFTPMCVDARTTVDPVLP